MQRGGLTQIVTVQLDSGIFSLRADLETIQHLNDVTESGRLETKDLFCLKEQVSEGYSPYRLDTELSTYCGLKLCTQNGQLSAWIQCHSPEQNSNSPLPSQRGFLNLRRLAQV